MTPNNNPNPFAMRRYGQQPQQGIRQNFQGSPAGQIANWYQRRRQQQQQGDQQMQQGMERQPQTPAASPPPVSPAPQAPVPANLGAPGPAQLAPGDTSQLPVTQERPGGTAVEQPPVTPSPINTERPGGAQMEESSPATPPRPSGAGMSQQDSPVTTPPQSQLAPDNGTAGAGQASPAFQNRPQIGGARRYFDDDQQESGSPELMAEGGIVSKPTSAILGDKGPEAVIPLTPTANAKLRPSGFLKARYQRPTGPAAPPQPIRGGLPLAQNRVYR